MDQVTSDELRFCRAVSFGRWDGTFLPLLVIALLFALPWVASSQNQPHPQQQRPSSVTVAYDHALELLQAGKASEALAEINASLAQQASSPGLYNLRGLADSRLGRYQEAEESFRKVIELLPRSALGYTNLASLLSQQGRHNEAMNLFRAALERDPQDFEALLGLGVTLAGSQKYGEAKPFLEKAWRQRPRDFQAGYEYALALRETHQPAKAQEILKRIVPPTQPSVAAQYFTLSAVLAEDEGDLKRAAELYATAYRMTPDSFDIYLALVRSSLGPGTVAEPAESGPSVRSVPDFRGLPQAPPRLSAEQHFTLGLLLASRGAYTLAIPHFEETLRSEPGSYAAAFNLALSYKQAGNNEAAILLVERTLKERPTAELHNLLASLDESAGRYVEAVNNYRRAVELEPDNEQFYFDLGAEYLAHFTFDPALEVFRLGTQRFSRSLRQHVGLGFAYYARREYLVAARAFLSALEIDASSPIAFTAWNSLPTFLAPSEWLELEPRLRHLAEAHPQTAEALYCYGSYLFRHELASGETRFEAAQSLLERAVQLKPGLAEVRLELGDLYVARGTNEKAVSQYLQAIQLTPNSEMAHYRLGQTYRNLNKLELAQQELARYTELTRHRREEMARSRSAIQQFILAQSPRPAGSQGPSEIGRQREP